MFKRTLALLPKLFKVLILDVLKVVEGRLGLNSDNQK
jgi:hypothetical protein